MSQPPANPKIYHITHVANLAGIIANGGLSSDAAILRDGGPAQTIGMSAIKRRRLEELEVSCHPGTRVGEYVPFYFCPRSIMLFVIHCANHPELTYRGGQDLIVHLESDLHTVVRWTEQNCVRWAFSLTNAGARYTELRSSLQELDELDWTAIASKDFRDPDVKEWKQAESLLFGFFPLNLVERVGVRTAATQAVALRALTSAGIRVPVEVLPEWYF
jgi:hypothetical protein